MSSPQRLAHRGTLADENTWLGIETALRAGVDGVEVDLQISSDGVVFLHHDRTLRRLAGRAASPLDLPWSELAEVVLPRDQRLLRLDALLGRWPGGKTLNLELKDGGDRLVAATLPLIDGRDDIVLSSFDPGMMRACVGAPHRRALLLETESPAWLHARGVAELQCDGVHLQASLVGAELVARYRALGVKIGVWGARSPKREAALVTLGIDRLISDYLISVDG